MTSQIENPIRDRVAYEMHLRFRKTRLDVGREWTGLYTTGENGERAPRAVDLAVVEKPRHRSPYAPTPAGVVEFKAVLRTRSPERRPAQRHLPEGVPGRREVPDPGTT
ncbi:hypothetical protein Shyd_72970 [Streptomyces hydrogenans]|uniref:Uncharacterized protein n=1 Tax=Streptomyces hydrogenans TaxID=1873719 RepID=A0ABQ3PLM3_9ACTN|nr:hypothetical protein Shyd_72970 [Streptomyces hydrogenans]